MTSPIEPSGTHLPPFRPLSGRVWSLGDPDRPDLSFNGIDPYGVEWIIADPKGWNSSPPVNLGLEDKPTHGSWFGRGAYKSRVVEVAGAFRTCGGGQDALDEAAERLQDVLDPTRDTLLAVTERTPKQLTVRPSAEVVCDPVRRNPRIRVFSFVLTAADPFKYAAGASGQETAELRLFDAGTVPGLTHPVEHPLDHGGATDLGGGRKNTTNIGQLPALPIIRITGPVVLPAVTNATTGQTFALDRSLDFGDEAVIDMEMQTVRINGASAFAAKAPRSRFWAVARRTNDLRFTADAYNPNARAFVTYRPRWK